jgi:hypothetical protein
MGRLLLEERIVRWTGVVRAMTGAFGREQSEEIQGKISTTCESEQTYVAKEEVSNK